MNSETDPIILGQSYHPKNVLITNNEHLFQIYDELFEMRPIKELLKYWSKDGKTSIIDIFSYKKDVICTNLSTLLSFCQEILEIALIYEILSRKETKIGDFILRDGTLRPLSVKSSFLVELGSLAKEKGVIIVAVTKQSAIKMELSYTFKQIDNYLQEKLKYTYSFIEKEPKRKKLCCWFEIPTQVLEKAYGEMYIKKSIKGGRGFGLFFAARLDYVEKLQNYDWIIVDINIFEAIPRIKEGDNTRDRETLVSIFKELTRLTQEHYILGYPYPLAEVHNFVTLKKHFKEEIVNRLKYSLYNDQRMDNVDIENIFLDTHDRF